MNIELLKEIKKRMRGEPKRVNIRSWQYYVRGCGTVGCIAGWAGIIKGYATKKNETECIAILPHGYFDWAVFGAHLLNLTRTEAERLFIPDSWPDDWRLRLSMTQPRTKEHVEVICEYIDFFTWGKTVDEPEPAPVEEPVAIKMPVKERILA